VRQGVWLRSERQPGTALTELPQGRLAAMQQALANDIAPVAEDRMLEPELRLLLQRIRARAWSLYD